jgi:MFS family permease
MTQVPDLDIGPAEAGPRTNTVVVVLAFAGIVVALMQTLVIPLIPALPRLLSASPSDAAWAVTATLLAGAVATQVVGRLGDMYGKRRMLLVSLGLLVIGSTVGALSTSLAPMVIGTGPGQGSAPTIGRVHPLRWLFFLLLWLGVTICAVGLYMVET